MAETTGTGTQAAPETQPQAGTVAPQAGAAAAATGTTTTSTSGGDGDEPVTLEEARRLRSENQQLRKRLKPLEDAHAAAEAATLTENQRLAQRLAELEARNSELQSAQQAASLREAAGAAARKLGFRNPDIAHRLIENGAVVVDEATGSPRNLEQLLGEVARQNPYLVAGTADFGGGPRGSSAAPGTDVNTLIRRAAGRG